MGVCSVPPVPDWNNAVWVNYAMVSLGIEKPLTKHSWNLQKHLIKPSHFHWGCLEQTGFIILAASVLTNILSAVK